MFMFPSQFGEMVLEICISREHLTPLGGLKRATNYRPFLCGEQKCTGNGLTLLIQFAHPPIQCYKPVGGVCVLHDSTTAH